MTIFLHEESITLQNGIDGETWPVATANPATFYDLIAGHTAATATEIYAQNFLPPGISKPPLVIVVPGSMGIAPSHIKKAELLTNAGIAVCLLDPFGARGVSSTVANQAQYSFAASAWDVLATVTQLIEQQQVDTDRIGAQGHSRGGAAVLSAACLSGICGQRDDVVGSLTGVYAAYPWCGQQFLNPRVGATRVRSVVGDLDEWCLPQQVQGYMQAMRLAGGDASWRVFAGAHHSFDRETAVELVADASVSPGSPTIYIEDSGICIHPVTGPCGPQTSERDLMLYGIKAGYGVRGAHLGTSGDLADAFHADMLQFWQSCFFTS